MKPDLREVLERARRYIKPAHPGDVQADADLRAVDDALATFQPSSERREAIARIIDPEAFANWERTEGNWRKDEARAACWPALDKADAILASGLVQNEAGWRDISTAPKDWTEIDLWCRNISEGSADQARFPAMGFIDGAWEDWHGYILEPKWKPTHWKPTPAPPIRSARDGGAET